MKRWMIQWGLCGMLFTLAIAGIVVALIGAFYNPPHVAMIISGTLMVAVASFALTLLAKVLGLKPTNQERAIRQEKPRGRERAIVLEKTII